MNEDEVYDGNVHVMPSHGIQHIESEDCWCEPTLSADFTDEGGHQVWVHKGYEELMH